jgi:hypothetical protein
MILGISSALSLGLRKTTKGATNPCRVRGPSECIMTFNERSDLNYLKINGGLYRFSCFIFKTLEVFLLLFFGLLT